MIWFVICIILTIIGAIALGLYEGEVDGRYDYGWKLQPRMFLALFIMLLTIPCFIGNVKTGEVGIKTRWGKVVSTNLSEGLQFKAPWEKIIKMNIKVQKYETTLTTTASTKDMQNVSNVSIAINYQLKETKAVELYRTVGTTYDEAILIPAIYESVKATFSKYTAEELITNRSGVGEDITNTLSERINNYGIDILAVSLTNLDFSAAYDQAIENKTIAEQNALTAEQNLKTAEANAKKKLIEAQAEADANKLKEKTLTKEILFQQFVEKWNGVLPVVTGGDNMLDISKLLDK